MDKKQKLMATPSCSELDRFSDLPNGVAHHILSFLTIPDVARFGCVSKRCGLLHLSTPTLKFEGFSRANLSTLDKRSRLLNALDSFMIRRGDDKIHTFRNTFRSCSTYRFLIFCADANPRIINWIDNALRCNVEVLDLELCMVSLTRLFQSILLCGSLKSLSVGMEYNYVSLTLPSSACFSNIECLKLKNIDVVDEGFFKWISSTCKSIKKLHLEEIQGIKHLSIESSSLQSFSFVYHYRLQMDPFHLSISADNLEDLVINWGFYGCQKLNIFAPKVRYMKWTGKLLIHQNFGEFKLLEQAELYLRPGGNDFLSEFLSSICRVQALIMKGDTLNTINALFEKGSMPASLDNVRQLQLYVGYFCDDLVPAMVSLLKELPNLSTLNINTDHPVEYCPRTNSSGYNAAYWKLLNLAFVNKLEEVSIELPNGSNGIELAWYILDYAQSLKKMVIVHSPEQSYFERKLLKRKKISNVRVVFQEYQRRGIAEQIRRRRLSNKG